MRRQRRRGGKRGGGGGAAATKGGGGGGGGGGKARGMPMVVYVSGDRTDNDFHAYLQQHGQWVAVPYSARAQVFWSSVWFRRCSDPR